MQALFRAQGLLVTLAKPHGLMVADHTPIAIGGLLTPRTVLAGWIDDTICPEASPRGAWAQRPDAGRIPGSPRASEALTQ